MSHQLDLCLLQGLEDILVLQSFHFIVLASFLRPIIHLKLNFWPEIGQGLFILHRYPTAWPPFIEKNVLSPLNVIGAFVKNLWLVISVLHSVPLINLSILMPISQSVILQQVFKLGTISVLVQNHLGSFMSFAYTCKFWNQLFCKVVLPILNTLRFPNTF